MRYCRLTAAVIVAALGSPAALAGPLNPPAGLVTPTQKPLAEVEPRVAINDANTPGDNDSSPSRFRITQPGSYYLAGNVTGIAGRIGVEVVASNVTIDLNGFTLRGVPGAAEAITTGITSQSNIRVHNGTVTDWPGNAIELVFVTSANLTDIRVVGSGGDGICTGASAIIERCSASTSGLDGFRLGTGAIVRACAASSNGDDGFDLSSFGVIEACTANENGSDGFEGGISVTVNACSSNNNTAAGFSISALATVTNCSAFGNATTGVLVGTNSAVTNCSAGENLVEGFVLGAGSTIAFCTAAANGGSGIRALSDCYIHDNTCDGNGTGATISAGIFTGSPDCRIERNNCTDNDIGINVTSGGNLIIANSCASNTVNYEIIAGNRFGPIVNITASSASGVSGDFAPSNLTSTDPFANFAH